MDLVIAKPCNAPAIKCFLNTHYWPREPTVAALWMSLDSPYLQMLTDKYSETGNLYLALYLYDTVSAAPDYRSLLLLGDGIFEAITLANSVEVLF